VKKRLTDGLLVLIGALFGVGLILLFLPGAARWINDDYITMEFQVEDGDIFHVQPNSIRPPQNPERVLARFRIDWGQWGYRKPRSTADFYPILALGDSYTEGQTVPYPWPDVLSREAGVPVRNLGFSGYGTQEYALVMEEYGDDVGPEVVLLAFFGANDVEFADREGDFNIDTDRADTVERQDVPDLPELENVKYPFPVQVILKGQAHDLAFLYQYLWWMNIEPDEVRDSENMRVIQETWRDVAASAGEVCKIVMYVPSKGEVYLPFLDYEDRLTMLDGTRRPLAEPGETLRMVDEPGGTVDTLLARRGNLQSLLRGIAEAEGFHFIDLTPVFEAAARDGARLFYAYDTHWNQTGHDVAGAYIAEQLALCD